MKKLIVIILLGMGLSACSSKNTLSIQYEGMSGDLSLVPRMQQIPDGERLAYQEVKQGSGQTLDSLIIEKVKSEYPLIAYVQQHFNALRLHGYQISDELTKKGKIKIGNGTQETTSILKTYRIVNLLGVKLYIAQYHVQVGDESIITISYASDLLANRTAFISSLSQLSFTF